MTEDKETAMAEETKDPDVGFGIYELDEDGEQWWIAANSELEALRIARGRYAIPAEPDMTVTAVRLRDDQILEIVDEDTGPDEELLSPPQATVTGRPGGYRITATAGQWASFIGNGTLLGGTVR